MSLIDLLTLTILLSLKYLLISPIIIGTAYVLNCTFRLKSKLSIDFINPIHPIWNKSSAHSFLPENLCTTLSTNLRFPFINSSLASLSPFFIFINSSFFSSFDSIGNFEVFTPHISTLFIKQNLLMELLIYSISIKRFFILLDFI